MIRGGSGTDEAIFVNNGATAVLNIVSFLGNIVIRALDGVGTVGGRINNIATRTAGGIRASDFT